MYMQPMTMSYHQGTNSWHLWVQKQRFQHGWPKREHSIEHESLEAPAAFSIKDGSKVEDIPHSSDQLSIQVNMSEIPAPIIDIWIQLNFREDQGKSTSDERK